jgi:hypothetical protein
MFEKKAGANPRKPAFMLPLRAGSWGYLNIFTRSERPERDKTLKFV